jgi:hypothetical protein
MIRDVYPQPGAEAVPAHLEDRYGISVDKATKLAQAWTAGTGLPAGTACLAGRPPERAHGMAPRHSGCSGNSRRPLETRWVQKRRLG